MLRTLFIFCCCGILAGCGIDYDGKTKLIFEGRVIDRQGNPIENIEVFTTISDGNTTDKIGVDATDENGNYRMIFPGADEDVVFRIHFNQKEYAPDEVLSWSSASIFNIGQDEVKDNDYLINFGETQLYPVAESVQLTLQVSENLEHYVEFISFEGLVDDNNTNYNFPEPSQDYYDYYDYETTFNVAKNQVLILKYIMDGGQVHEVQIPVGEESLTYTIE